MKRSIKFIIGICIIIISVLIAIISTYLMFNSLPTAQPYYNAISNHESGDIVYVFGEFSHSGLTRDNSDYGKYFIELYSVESVEYDSDNQEAYVDLGSMIYFDDPVGYYEEENIIIKGRIFQNESEKYIKGIDVINADSAGYIGKDLVKFYPFFLYLILTIPFISIGAVLFFFGYHKEKNHILPPESELKMKKQELFNIFLFFISSIMLYTFYIPPLIILLIIGLSLFLQIRIIKSKYNHSKEINDDVLCQRFEKGLKLVRIGSLIIIILLIIISISSLIFYPSGGLLPFEGNILSTENFYILFFLISGIFIVGSFIFFFGISIDSRRYHPEIEKMLMVIKKKKFRLIFRGIILLFFIFGIIYPFIFQLVLPTLTSQILGNRNLNLFD